MNPGSSPGRLPMDADETVLGWHAHCEASSFNHRCTLMHTDDIGDDRQVRKPCICKVDAISVYLWLNILLRLAQA